MTFLSHAISIYYLLYIITIAVGFTDSTDVNNSEVGTIQLMQSSESSQLQQQLLLQQDRSFISTLDSFDNNNDDDYHNNNNNNNNFDDVVDVLYDDDDDDDDDNFFERELQSSGLIGGSTNISSGGNSSLSHIFSVTSLLALKREKMEEKRKETVQLASRFKQESLTDSMVDSGRQLRMVNRRMSQMIQPPMKKIE